jgi:hypothetical protein
MDPSIFSLDELRATLLDAIARAVDGSAARVPGSVVAPDAIRLTALLTPAGGSGSSPCFRFRCAGDGEREVVEAAFVWAAGPPRSLDLVDPAAPKRPRSGGR